VIDDGDASTRLPILLIRSRIIENERGYNVKRGKGPPKEEGMCFARPFSHRKLCKVNIHLDWKWKMTDIALVVSPSLPFSGLFY